MIKVKMQKGDVKKAGHGGSHCPVARAVRRHLGKPVRCGFTTLTSKGRQFNLDLATTEKIELWEDTLGKSGVFKLPHTIKLYED